MIVTIYYDEDDGDEEEDSGGRVYIVMMMIIVDRATLYELCSSHAVTLLPCNPGQIGI